MTVGCVGCFRYAVPHLVIVNLMLDCRPDLADRIPTPGHTPTRDAVWRLLTLLGDRSDTVQHITDAGVEWEVHVTGHSVVSEQTLRLVLEVFAACRVTVAAVWDTEAGRRVDGWRALGHIETRPHQQHSHTPCPPQGVPDLRACLEAVATELIAWQEAPAVDGWGGTDA